jgi:hypothetical protein
MSQVRLPEHRAEVYEVREEAVNFWSTAHFHNLPPGVTVAATYIVTPQGEWWTWHDEAEEWEHVPRFRVGQDEPGT